MRWRGRARTGALGAVTVLAALVVAAPSGATVTEAAKGAAAAEGFNVREAIGTDVSLVGKGAAKGLFRVRLKDGTIHTTHGPDPADAFASHGPGIDLGDTQRDPACVTSSAHQYYQVLYGRPSNVSSNLGTATTTARTAVKVMDAMLDEQSQASGGPHADYRVLCSSALISVTEFTGPATSVLGFNSYASITNAAITANFDQSDVNYLIFYDSTAPAGLCGIGDLAGDERLTGGNLNNQGGFYAIAWGASCWGTETPMHESAHNMGAVQYHAPDATGFGGHCNDENDVMCYQDGGNLNQTIVTACTPDITFDCGFDTYFDTLPESGEWLASHWNVGSCLNRFIALDPAPACPDRTPVLKDGVARKDQLPGPGVNHYLINVPRRTNKLIVKVTVPTTQACSSTSPSSCNVPDLDLLLEDGAKLTFPLFDCVSQKPVLQNEKCAIGHPARGKWSAGVVPASVITGSILNAYPTYSIKAIIRK
jgi:hypothetical protein